MALLCFIDFLCCLLTFLSCSGLHECGVVGWRAGGVEGGAGWGRGREVHYKTILEVKNV